jgi:hypothetical protein
MMINDQKINRSLLLSHMEKLLVANVERLLRSRRGLNPVPFSLSFLKVSKKTLYCILVNNNSTLD